MVYLRCCQLVFRFCQRLDKSLGPFPSSGSSGLFVQSGGELRESEKRTSICPSSFPATLLAPVAQVTWHEMDVLLLRRCIAFLLFLWSSPVVFAAIGSQCQKNCSASDPLIRQDLAVPLGNAINIFHDYGFLSSTIHVAPIQNNFTEPHQLFRAHTQNVLDDNVYHLTIKRSSRFVPDFYFNGIC